MRLVFLKICGGLNLVGRVILEVLVVVRVDDVRFRRVVVIEKGFMLMIDDRWLLLKVGRFDDYELG